MKIFVSFFIIVFFSSVVYANTINLDHNSHLELQSFGSGVSIVKCKNSKPNCVVSRIGEGFSLSIGDKFWGSFKTYQDVAKEAKALRADQFCK